MAYYLKKVFQDKKEAIIQPILEAGIPLKNCEPPAGYRAEFWGGSETSDPHSLTFCISRDNERERIWLHDERQIPRVTIMVLKVSKKKSDDKWIAKIELIPDAKDYKLMKDSLKTHGWSQHKLRGTRKS